LCRLQQINEDGELAYLRGALEKKAGQVLRDYGTEVTESLKKLTGIPKDRFGGTNMADKYRIKVGIEGRKKRAVTEPVFAG